MPELSQHDIEVFLDSLNQFDQMSKYLFTGNPDKSTGFNFILPSPQITTTKITDLEEGQKHASME